MKRSSVGRAKLLDVIRFESFLTHRVCVSALKWLPGRGRHFPPLRPVMLDLAANPGQKIIAGCENGNGSAHQVQAQRGRDRKTA
ncbi:MAG: hypothetical protein GDA36_05075 [Rhodobacteraceae bacterium]|nr:hypothetical protein [Paracoccaceae bacterium]